MAESILTDLEPTHLKKNAQTDSTAYNFFDIYFRILIQILNVIYKKE